ncbi:MAG: amidase [Actinomycetota bacterium]
MGDLWKLGAAEAAARMRSGDFAPSELMDDVLDRVDAMNPGLNAIVLSHAERAREQAIAADAALTSGEAVGDLHGVPVTIKHNIDLAGDPNPNGVPALANHMATENHPLVDRLTEAGAIVIGRTNTPEFSMRATTDNPLHGRTYNPWGEDISPGGSSGGAGSACAAGMGAIHHGNDIGGSLRFPSFANGVMTVKPSSFRIPVYNGSAPAERGPLAGEISVQGIIARHAADLRLATRLMVQPDPRDPNSPPVPWDGPDLNNRRVAVCRDSAGYDLHPEIDALITKAAEQLLDAGYEVVDVDTPPILEAAEGWFSALSTEMSELFREPLELAGSETIRQIFDWYFERSELLDLKGYITASGHRTALKRDWSRFLTEYPLVLTPFLMRPFFDWNYDATGFEAVDDLFRSAIWSTGINYLGLPAGVISTGFADDRPAAVQIVGQRWREDLICDALEAIEERNGILAPQLWSRT